MQYVQQSLGSQQPDRSGVLVQTYVAYSQVIKRYLQKNLRSEDDAEDLMQDTYLRFQKHIDQVDMTRARNLLFTIARNLMIDRLRHLKISEVDPQWDIEELLDPHSCVERVVSVQKEFEVLCQAIVQLPPRCRQVFLLRNFQHLSHKAIADQLVISVSTVEKHLATAMTRCQIHLARVSGKGEFDDSDTQLATGSQPVAG